MAAMRARPPALVRVRQAAAALLLVAPVLAATGLDLRIHGGSTVISHVPDSGVAPPPPVVESIGAGVGIWQEPLGAAFFLAWTADLTLYGTYYEWWAPEGRPRPTELETAAWMWVLGGLLGSDFAIGWAISEVLARSLAAGLDLNIRAPPPAATMPPTAAPISMELPDSCCRVTRCASSGRRPPTSR